MVVAARTTAVQQGPSSPRCRPSPSPLMENQGCQQEPGQTRSTQRQELSRGPPATSTRSAPCLPSGSPTQCRARASRVDAPPRPRVFHNIHPRHPSPSSPFLLDLFLQPSPRRFWVIPPSRNLAPQGSASHQPKPLLSSSIPQPATTYILPWPCHQHDHRCPNRPIQGAPWSPWGTRSVALGTADGSPPWNSPLPLPQATLTAHQSHPRQGFISARS